MSPFRPGAARAFTLVELILAIALMAMLLVALLTFVFSMGEIWGFGREQRLFEQHVNAVTRHVDALVRRGALPLGESIAAEPFTVREVRTETAGTRTLLSFRAAEGDRLLEWPAAPLPDVQCALGTEPGEGLVLYWQSLLERDRDTRPARRVVVSPLVSEIAYLYHDPTAGRWDSRPDLIRAATGRWRVPDRLRLTFIYGRSRLERTITLPLGNGAVPVF